MCRFKETDIVIAFHQSFCCDDNAAADISMSAMVGCIAAPGLATNVGYGPEAAKVTKDGQPPSLQSVLMAAMRR